MPPHGQERALRNPRPESDCSAILSRGGQAALVPISSDPQAKTGVGLSVRRLLRGSRTPPERSVH
eukprot:6917764-Alexandrium_andersonii.AAC.1